jgi:hypothetical protein
MKPTQAFQTLCNLFNRFISFDGIRRWRDLGPGEIIKTSSPEIREALSKLKSEDIAPDKIRNEDCWWGDDYQNRQLVLDFEKKLGIQPPLRKKYGDYER